MSIQPVNNNSQNTIYALSAGTLAGAAGIYAGYQFAPREVNSLNELLETKSDVFYHTLENMQSKNPEVYLKAYPIIGAKTNISGFEHRLNTAFPGDKFKTKDLEKLIDKQNKKSLQTINKIDIIVDKMKSKKGTNYSLENYTNLLKNLFPEKFINVIKEDLIATVGEDIFKAKQPINKELIDILENSAQSAKRLAKQENDMYTEFFSLEKDGIVYKNDMLESAKKSLRNINKEITRNISFEDIKHYIPQKGQAKLAAIIGSTAAILTAASVKLFKKTCN